MTATTITVDRFLTIEDESRRQARLRAPAREVRRFHAAVRRFSTTWCTRPSRRIALAESEGGVALNLELEDRYGWVPVLILVADHINGEFVLRGPAPDRKKKRMSVDLRKSLDRLNKAWRLLPGADPTSDLYVSVHLPRLADSGFDRFLETALEAVE